MTDAQILTQIQNHWISSRGFRAGIPLDNALKGYRALKKAGKTDNDIVIYWSSPAVGMSRMDAATFVTAMKKINAGEAIQDPFERPTIGEVYAESGLPGSKDIPLGQSRRHRSLGSFRCMGPAQSGQGYPGFRTSGAQKGYAVRVARLGNFITSKESDPIGLESALEKDKTKSTAALVSVVTVFLLLYFWKAK